MTAVPVLDACTFYTTRDGSGRFIGRVREFPDLRTPPQASALDARDAIITATTRKIADLADAIDLQRGRTAHPHSGAQ